MRTLGNRPDLFGKAQYPNASTIKQPTSYAIPPEALKDDRFAALMEAATKYIGYPYVWGGSSPSTSFDCSGYISWVLNHSGWNVGRQTAQGPVSYTHLVYIVLAGGRKFNDLPMQPLDQRIILGLWV